MNKLYRAWKGYVRLSIKGDSPERFINIALNRNIKMDSIKKVKKDEYHVNVLIDDFKKKIPSCRRKAEVSIKILAKGGCPYFVFRHRKRKFFMAFGILAIIVCILSCSVLWGIDIEGGSGYDRYKCRYTLGELGIRPGIFLRNINMKELAEDIMIKHSDLSWVGVSKEGLRLKIKLIKDEDNTEIPLPGEEGIPCDIIATKDGVIEKIHVYRGEALVSPGSYVKKGQVLVSGNGEHALADIKALTWYESISEISSTKVQMVETGKMQKEKSIIFFGFEIKWPWNDKEKYEYSNSLTQERFIELGKGNILPVSIVEKVVTELKCVEVILSQEESLEYAKISASDRLNVMIGGEGDIIDTGSKIVEEEKGKFFVLWAICVENIGVDKTIY